MPDIHTISGEPTEEEREMMIPRMKAFIFPNKPRTLEEKAAFANAVRFQINHDKTVAEKTNGAELPDGAKSFTIGSFHMEFEDGTFDSRLTRKTICPSAYGILLLAGLLYRGVEGRCPNSNGDY